MNLADFEVEQWMNDYEGQAKYNLTDTSVQSLTFQELAAYEPELLENLVLDYGSITGDPLLRKEILRLYRNQEQNTLTLSQGCLQGNEMIMLTLLEAQDHVITFSPGYQQFSDYPRSLGCSVTEINRSQKDWSFSMEEFRQTLQEHPDTKLVILNNPANPTGARLSQKQMEEFASICREHDVWLLCDEVYKRPEAVSMADLYEKAIVTGSFSKLYGLAGLRFGWIKGHPDVIHTINVRRDYSIISTGPLKDRLALIAFRHQKELLERADALIEKNRQDIKAWLQDNPLFSCILPQDGTVAFLKYHKDIPSKQFATDLLRDTGIFFVPGACFGCEYHLRLGFGQKHENLPEILQVLQKYLESYQPIQQNQ